MTIEVKVPDIGDFSEVPVVTILVAVGDTIAEEDPIVESPSSSKLSSEYSVLPGIEASSSAGILHPSGVFATRKALASQTKPMLGEPNSATLMVWVCHLFKVQYSLSETTVLLSLVMLL